MRDATLIQPGLQVLAERGVDALTLREVARRAEVSQAAPYHHFADKADLVSAIRPARPRGPRPGAASGCCRALKQRI